MLLHARSWALAETPRSVWSCDAWRTLLPTERSAPQAKLANRGIIRGLCKPAGPAPAGPPCGSRGQALLYNSAPLHTQFTLFVSRRTHCVPCTDTLSLSPPPFHNSYLPHRHPKPYPRTPPHFPHLHPPRPLHPQARRMLQSRDSTGGAGQLKRVWANAPAPCNEMCLTWNAEGHN